VQIPTELPARFRFRSWGRSPFYEGIESTVRVGAVEHGLCWSSVPIGYARVTKARALAAGSGQQIWLMAAAAAGGIRPGAAANRDAVLAASASVTI
jgi:hypothetical protein